MAYRLLEFRCGTDRAQGYVLQGTGQHEGTTEQISVEDMMHYGTDGARLAHFLDTRFLRAHARGAVIDAAQAESER